MNSTPSSVATLLAASKRYGAAIALDSIDLRVERGKILALLGPNGAGKSTTISLLLGLANPDSGCAELFGQSPHRLAARRRIGIMLQNAMLPDSLRVDELIEQTAGYYPAPKSLSEIATIAGLEKLLKARYDPLSGGQKRRVQFALAICGNPELMFLDEPTTGLDIDARKSLWAAVRESVQDGAAVLLTTHYIEEAEALADTVVVLMRGRVLTQGSVDELRQQNLKQQIRCVSSLLEKEVRTWSGVIRAERRDQRLEIEALSAEDIVRRLLAADTTLAELEVRRAGLSEAFVKLTQGDLP